MEYSSARHRDFTPELGRSTGGGMSLRSISNMLLVTAALSLLAACKPPVSDDESARGSIEDSSLAPSPPIDSPDNEGAIWSASETQDRIIYGQPGSPPYLALECKGSGPDAMIGITRFAPADEGTGALLALVGNSHVARVPVDSVWNGTAWIWEGQISAHSANLEVLTGQRAATATVPGAGQITLNPSHAPAQLVSECRGENPVPSQ